MQKPTTSIQEKATRIEDEIFVAASSWIKDAGLGYRMHDVPPEILGRAAIKAVTDAMPTDEDCMSVGSAIYTAAYAWIEGAGIGYKMDDVPLSILGHAAIECYQVLNIDPIEESK